MPIRTRILQAAQERGLTAAEVARRLHLYPSNLSNMDAGRRTASLRVLARIAQLLGCGLGDLLESLPPKGKPLFGSRALERRVQEWDEAAPDGLERGWVHGAMLAWQHHHRGRR